MNKILTLYNIEFKRIYKLYLSLIGALFIGNLLAIFKVINYTINRIANENKLVKSFSLLKTNLGQDFITHTARYGVYFYTTIILAIAVFICLGYAAYIWYRDYFSNSKTIYTLLSLPQPRFNIYLAKLMVVVFMIYGVIISQVLFWDIDLNILKLISGIGSSGFTNVYKMIQHNIELKLISPYFSDFLMIDFLGIILAVVVIFTGVLIERSFKKIGIILGTLYIVFSIIGYFYIIINQTFVSDGLLFKHIVYYIFIFGLSLFISYKLLNKRICV